MRHRPHQVTTTVSTNSRPTGVEIQAQLPEGTIIVIACYFKRSKSHDRSKKPHSSKCQTNNRNLILNESLYLQIDCRLQIAVKPVTNITYIHSQVKKVLDAINNTWEDYYRDETINYESNKKSINDIGIKISYRIGSDDAKENAIHAHINC